MSTYRIGGEERGWLHSGCTVFKVVTPVFTHALTGDEHHGEERGRVPDEPAAKAAGEFARALARFGTLLLLVLAILFLKKLE